MTARKSPERKSPRAGRPKLHPASSVEQQIRAAEAAGEFDDLPGKGRPFEGLGEAYDPAWWAKKFVQREQISVVPPALEVRRELEKLLEELPGLRSERMVRDRVGALDAKIARVNATVTSGPATSVPRLDVEAVVERWHQTRDRRE